MKEKILIIGLDGATWKLLDKWIKEGKLKWFRKARRNWFSSKLISTIPPLTGCAWVTFQTGVNPGKHGIFDFVKYQKSGENSLISSGDIKYPTIWRWLEKSGKKSVIINMPITYPLKETDSIVVSSLLTPPGKIFAYPDRIYEKLKKMNYIVDMEEVTFGGPQESMRRRKQIFPEIIRMAETRIKCALELMDEDWDLFFVLFKSTDITQHLFWNSQETLKLYQLLESGIQKLERKAQSKTKNLTTIVCSDHGFNRGEKVSFSLYRWLKNEGYLRYSKPIYFEILRFGYQIIKRIYPRLSKSDKKGLENIRKYFTKNEVLKLLKTSRMKSKAWPTPFGIYLNDKSIAKKLYSKLKTIKYKNKKIFKEIYFASNIYLGECLKEAPDIVFLPQDWVRIEANPFQESVTEKLEGYLAGDHYSDREGIILIKPSPSFEMTKNLQCRIEDIFPSIATVFGKKFPAYCDGKSLLQRKGETAIFEKRRVLKLISRELDNLGDN